MIKQIAKKALLLMAVLVGMTSFVAAEEQANFDQGYPVDASQMLGTYNAPARYDVRGAWDVYFTGSFILWQTIEQGLDLGMTSATDANANSSQIIHSSFNYKPGFKVSLGSNLGIDEWIASLEYTFFHPKTSSSKSRVSSDPFTLVTFHDPHAGVTDSDLTKISSSWKLGIDLLDLSFARPCYIGTKLTIAPFFGVKGGWMHQRLHNHMYTASYTYYAPSKERTWLIGPRIGFNGNWLLDDGFRFYGNFAASLFYQHFKQSLKEYYIAVGGTTYTYLLNLPSYINGLINPAIETTLGLAWGTYLWNNKMHLDLLAGYELQVFFNQNMMKVLEEENTSSYYAVPAPGDLMMHGLTVSLRLDF
ncbi:MAG: Lpg1974 family pore-forming outer membrane protein [Parachlamydiales bacterium]|jgi:hypothetical protein